MDIGPVGSRFMQAKALLAAPRRQERDTVTRTALASKHSSLLDALLWVAIDGTARKRHI